MSNMAEAEAVRQLQDQLPEEEEKGNLGKMLRYVADLVQGGWTFRQALANLGELNKMGQHLDKLERIMEKVEELADNGKKAILKGLEYQKRNCTEAMKAHYYDQLGCSLEELYEGVAQDKLTEHENTKKMIIDGMRSYHQNESNKMVTDMVTGSALVAVFQLVKIYIAWKQISAASNVIQNPNKFTTINQNLQRMETMVTELLDMCDRNPRDSRINRKMMTINTLFTSTLGKISDLKATINGHIQSLDLLADYSAVDGVVNIVTAASQGYQVWHTWSNLTSFTKFLGVASVAVFTGLGYGNYRTYQLSQDTLKDLRRDLNEAIRLQDMLQDLHDQAAQAIAEIHGME